MGIHLRWEPRPLVDLLALPAAPRRRLVADLRARTVGLDELAGRAVTAREVVAAFEAALSARLGIRLSPGAWLAEEEATARRLCVVEFTPLDR
jgi:hypothetical protein